MNRSLWSRFKKDKAAVASLLLIAVIVISVVLAPVIAPHDPEQIATGPPLTPPKAGHWLGTDDLGRDIFSRLLYGGRISLTIGFSSVAIALVLGTVLGLFAGYFRKAEPYIMGIVEILMAFPAILRAIAIVAVLGSGLMNTIIAIALGSVPVFARLMRSLVLAEKNRDYVVSARALGMSEVGILFRHLLPNTISTLIVYSTLTLANAILTSASLSFLGLGVPPPAPEWGAMVHAGQEFLRKAPHIALVPSLMLFVVVLAFNLMGDGLRDALDSKLQV